jgi:murein DD-endopeptidase MepM/ murein hydrolase activator NlpD
LRVAVRPSQGRTILFLAFLALAAPTTVLGAGGTVPPVVPEPREMVLGAASGYRLPFKGGMEVQVVQGWGTSYSHNGRSEYAYDFGLYNGTPVVAAATGVVAYTHSGETRCGGPELRPYANLVTINHPDGSATSYGHL